MAEEDKSSGALETQTPLSEIVDKPKLTDAAPAVVQDKPEPQPKPERKQKSAVPEGYVPLSEVLDTRDKYKAAAEERDRYKRAWDEHQRKLAADQDKDPPPDMFKDPQGYGAWVERQIGKQAEAIAKKQVEPIMAQVSESQLRLSEMTAERHLGEARFKALNEWITKQGPQFNDWCTSQPDPYWAAWQEYRKRTTFERLGNDDLETYVENEVKRRMALNTQPAQPNFEEDDPDLDADRPATPAPRSFAGSRSSDPTRDQAGRFTGPRPLGELVREKDQRKRR